MTTGKTRLKVLNLDTARFKCVYPTCGGGCCKDSRPPVDPGEDKRIKQNLKKFLPMLRPRARRVIESRGYRTARKKEGRQMLAVVDHYCVFWNDGCVLHKVGAAEGDKNRYKPGTCITFPMDQSDSGDWYVRQWGTEGEEWTTLDCLNPKASKRKPVDTLTEELAFIERVEAGQERWRD
jgi:hypothetical protein